MSSSPGLPELPSIAVRRPGIDTFGSKGPKARAIGDSLTTATKVSRSNRRKDAAAEKTTLLDAITEIAKPARKPRASKEKSAQGDGVNKPSNKPRVRKAANTTKDAVLVQKVPASRSRKKSVSEDGQTKLSSVRVTKSSALLDDTKAKKASRKNKVPLEKTAKASHHFAPSVNIEENQDDPLDLYDATDCDRAIPRRMDWTPPRTATSQVFDLALPCDTEIGADLGGFKELLGDFGFTRDVAIPATAKETGLPISVRKRKLIELVKINEDVSEEATSQPKLTKKKTRTLTELATSAYSAADDGVPQPILKYISRAEEAAKAADTFKKPGRPRSNNPSKKSSLKQSKPELILFSPESAMRQANKQEFVFGTSSQLAREESPSFLRELHLAMQASNRVDEIDTTVVVQDPAGEYVNSSVSQKYTAVRNLWQAANRGSNGELLELETVDLTITPEPVRHQSSEQYNRQASDAILTPLQPEQKIEPEIIDCGTENGPSGHTASTGVLPDYASGAKVLGPVEAAIREQLMSSPAPLKPTVSGVAGKAPMKRKTSKEKSLLRPDYEGYSDAKLAKELRSYHFKPVKGRAGMIALLEKCWEGRQRMALGDLGTNAILQTSPLRPPITQQKSPEVAKAPPKRPRGRPRKDAAVVRSTDDALSVIESDSDAPLASRSTPKSRRRKPIDEISDSDTPTTPSPPRRHASLIGRPALPLEISVDASDAEATSTLEQTAALHKAITSAVKACPRSTNTKEPSWHEKMLLYDPIVLEDLTVWLNTGALEKAGWDDEVDPKEVKLWCNSKGICCLWRENLRGGARARY